ncbi:hypothetical protein CKO28_02885 [Rhodovibrio sodomensis]|uniref:Uncharacterized protein n=1 Tax=Rhodovibrio sodomensis TaxID=1088 RepID=A0ABS1D995_9PROT|nr:hypothetical protein [Rhodovibrio sodomensis]MBK1666988.1 hypothetical protein [Rhodovibrio sodomensis]
MASYRLFHLDGAALKESDRDEDLFQATFGDGSDSQVVELAEAGFYREAALIEAADNEDLEHTLRRIWVATQNIEASWADAPLPEVAPSKPRQRSTSVGDLVVSADGRLHVCARIGWREIGAAPAVLRHAAA